MATDLLDNGDAAVLVLLGSQGRLDEDRLVLPGGGTAEVYVDEDGDTLVQVEAGKVRSQELVRAALRSPALTVYGDVLDLVVASTTDDYDRYVLSADLEHRHLFTRQWSRRETAGGPVVALVGHSPFRAETHGEGEEARQLIETTMRLLRHEADAPAKLHVLNVFTRRADSDDEVSGVPGDRRGDPGQRTEALAEADIVVASWGAVPPAGEWAVDAVVEELREAKDRGARVLVRSVGGDIATVGAPAQPSAHRDVKDGTRLVDAPSEWLYGGELV